jgi:hypothetical protein
MFQILMSMQMDAEFKEEQIGTPFVWVGALEGVFWGWVVPQDCPPQNLYVPVQKQKARASWLRPPFGSIP